MKLKTVLFITSLMLAQSGVVAQASCRVLNSDGQPSRLGDDGIARVLGTGEGCPREVFEFRARLEQAGLRLETAMVANRGYHNPGQGSFSLFETATGVVAGTDLVVRTGEFFFGHFIVPEDGSHIQGAGRLTNDQNPAEGSLMVEAFAWDPAKGYFNFYELRGNGSEGTWFYRGDSSDILADNTLLHRQPDPGNPKFGTRLRCTACHSSGGPIMKELGAPHNDWWEPVRKLDLGGRVPDEKLKPLLERLVPARVFAQSVAAGLLRLNRSPGFQAVRASHSLPENLRPLFCPVELNLASDPIPNDQGAARVRVSPEFFVDNRLLPAAARPELAVGRPAYEQALSMAGAGFPETELADGDHAWLSPVKALSDKLAIDSLINAGVIDYRFAAAVLAVDFTSPVFSPARCGLLRLVPEQRAEGWQRQFVANLSQNASSAAHELYQNLTQPERTRAYFASQAARFLNSCAQALKEPGQVQKYFALLVQRRTEVLASEISRNPRGQILEPGFRVIFPTTTLKIPPGFLSLTRDCKVTRTPGR